MTEENNQQPEIEETELVEETEETTTEEVDFKQQLEEAQDRYLRVQAELANIQKRNLKERQDAAKYRSQNLATELLPVIDNLERALEIEVDDEKSINFKKGVEMVYNMMVEALKTENIEAINPLNESFDPNFHMSIQVQEAEEGQESDTVINVVQKGYKLNDRILRPAMVIVAQ